MGDKEDSLEVGAFLEEMISIIDGRLKRQEMSIAELQAGMKQIRSTLSNLSRARPGPMIDKSVLKVLKQ